MIDSARSYDRLLPDDLRRLGKIARLDRGEFFSRKPQYRPLEDQIIAVALCQGAALQYVNETTKPDQDCEGCQLYTAGADGTGKCQLFAKGLVKGSGWCASWVQKVS